MRPVSINFSHGRQGKWTGNAEKGRPRLIILLSVESLLVALMDRGRTTTMAINFKYNRPMSHWLLWFVGRHWMVTQSYFEGPPDYSSCHN